MRKIHVQVAAAVTLVYQSHLETCWIFFSPVLLDYTIIKVLPGISILVAILFIANPQRAYCINSWSMGSFFFLPV